MSDDRTTLMQRANELLADITELEEDLDNNPYSELSSYRFAKDIRLKRSELDLIRYMLDSRDVKRV